MLQLKIFNSRGEWLEGRKNFIGGSDAACILGMNPYTSNTDLFDIKTGRKQQDDISGKDVVIYGTKAEHLLRGLFELDHPELEVGYKENNMFTNTSLPFAHASLDGWLRERETGKRGIWECKTALIQSKAQSEHWKAQIPDNYYVQLIHQLMVTGFDFAIMTAQLKYNFDGEIYKKTIEQRINREDVKQDIEYLETKEREFWGCVTSGNRPARILPQI